MVCLKSVVVSVILFVGCSSSQEQSSGATRAYTAWCEYSIERDAVQNSNVDECVRELRSQGVSVPDSPEKLRQYIVLEQLIIRSCDRQKGVYESLEQCKSAVTSSLSQALSDEVSSTDFLVSLAMSSGALTDSPNGCRSTWNIGGKTYNDPWGLDYKNDSNDCYGDGR